MSPLLRLILLLPVLGVASGEEAPLPPHARVRMAGHEKAVGCVAFSPDGKTLASGAFDNTVILWDLGDVSPSPIQPAQANQLEALWDNLGGDDAPSAWRAVCALGASGQAAADFLESHLPPAAPVSPEAIRRAIVDLDDDDFKTREKASAFLEVLGPQAESALRETMRGSPSLEVQARIKRLLDSLGTPPGELLRQVRSVQALERMGNPKALALLERLSKGDPQARLTQEAAASAVHLKRGTP